MSCQPFLPTGLSWCARIVVSGGSLLTSLTACLSLTFVYAGSSFFRPDLGFATRVSVVVCREGDVRPDGLTQVLPCIGVLFLGPRSLHLDWTDSPFPHCPAGPLSVPGGPVTAPDAALAPPPYPRGSTTYDELLMKRFFGVVAQGRLCPVFWGGSRAK